MSLLNNLTLDDINKYFMNSVDTKKYALTCQS